MSFLFFKFVLDFSSMVGDGRGFAGMGRNKDMVHIPIKVRKKVFEEHLSLKSEPAHL